MKRQCAKVFVCCCLAFAAAAVSAFAAPVLVNRTVLTVQNEVYTSAQAEVWLAIWSRLVKTDIVPESIWNPAAKLDVGGKQSEFLQAYKKWPRDAHELLYLGLVWSEVKRLNLFTLSDAEIDKSVATLRRALHDKTASATVKSFLQPEASATFKGLVERSLRAQTYLKVRGDLEKNPSLANVFWYWHTTAEVE